MTLCWEAVELALSGCRKGCMEQEVVEVGAWRSKVVPLYLWSSKTDCGQASAWSLALNLSEQATKGIPIPCGPFQNAALAGKYDKTRHPGSDW
jgi:hypothetical protein